jgi:ABC-type Mn2+/Zn2+ transport system ATPase subunit
MKPHDLLLRARALEVGFGRTAILPAIDLELRRGELWGLIGRNGAGKTTLLRTLLGLQAPVAGEIVRPPSAAIGYVPQRHAIDPLVPARAKDLIAEGADRGWSFLRPVRDAEARARIARAIEATHSEALLGRRYRDLSEGQKQRVLLARAVAGAPDLLVLDEPTSAMDLVAEREVTTLLAELRERFGMGIVLVSHHLGLVAKMADRLVFLDSDERVAVSGTVAEVLAHPVFARRYGAVLTKAITQSTPPPPGTGDGARATEAS